MLSIAAILSGIASLAGVFAGLYCLIPLGLLYLLIYLLRLQEWVGGKKKPLAEQVDQGRKAARPLG
jgi:hypothetical protein